MIVTDGPQAITEGGPKVIDNRGQTWHLRLPTAEQPIAITGRCNPAPAPERGPDLLGNLARARRAQLTRRQAQDAQVVRLLQAAGEPYE